MTIQFEKEVKINEGMLGWMAGKLKKKNRFHLHFELTTGTNVAPVNESSPFKSEFTLLKLFEFIADLTNNWFVNLVGVEIASSSARAKDLNDREKNCYVWEQTEALIIRILHTKCIEPLRMLHFIWLGGNGAPPIDAIFVWLFGLSVAVIRFNVSVLLSKSEVLLIVTLQ